MSFCLAEGSRDVLTVTTVTIVRMSKRLRTAAPGSRPRLKKQRANPSRQLVGLSCELPYEPKLRHTALSRTAMGRRKEEVSLVSISNNPDTESNPLEEETELETFQNFLGDNEWLPDDINSTETGSKSKSKKTRVSLTLITKTPTNFSPSAQAINKLSTTTGRHPG